MNIKQIKMEHACDNIISKLANGKHISKFCARCALTYNWQVNKGPS